LKGRREQPDKGPIDPVVNDVATFRRMIEAGIGRQDRFVGHSGIIKREGADEVPITRNAMGVCRMSTRQKRECDRSAPN
jgi:hypothetical protein